MHLVHYSFSKGIASFNFIERHFSMKVISTILLALWLVGCSSTQRYQGPARPASEVAIVTKKSSDNFYYHKINGERRGVGNIDRLEFLPGGVSIHMVYSSPFLVGKSYMLVMFAAVAGKEYEMMLIENRNRWGVSLVETSSGKIIATGIPVSE